MPRPRVLILSYFDISVDPRVLKQVRRLVREYDVVTCAPGPRPHPDVEHIELDPTYSPPRGRIGNAVDDLAREWEWFGWTYRQLPMVKLVSKVLRGQRFDAAIANDADTVGVAIKMVGAERVHADLHEYYPGLPVVDDKFGRRQTRYWTWLTERHCARARSATTVGPEIAERYRAHGLQPGVVTNATPFADLTPAPTSRPLRVVHSGNAFRDRGLAEIMRAVAATRQEMTLDLYLVKSNLAEYEPLARLAEELGPRITIREPVPQSELIATLHAYDIGIHVLPPTSENNALALPNKFFDFVQARLAVVVGPSLEMARLVRERGFGVVAESFAVDDVAAALDALGVEEVDAMKRASHAAARDLSAEAQVEVWADAIAAIVS